MSDQLETVPQPGLPPTPSGSAFGQLARIFYEPSKVFAEIATRPTWLLPVIVLVVIGLVGNLVLTPKIDWDGTINEQLANRNVGGNLTDAQKESMIETSKKIATITGYATPVLVPVILLIMAGVYLLGLKTFSSTAGFKNVFAMVAHAAVPASLVSGVARIGVSFGRQSFTAQEIETLVKSSLAAFLSTDAAKALKTLTGFVDLFIIWQIVLLAIGLTIVGKVRKGQAWTIVAVVWGVWILGKVALAAIF